MFETYCVVASTQEDVKRSICYMMKVWMSLPLICFLSCTSGDEECGGTFQDSSGIIQTPNFPKKFKVPIHCRWVINATDHSGDDTSIMVYFTQLFVTRGLKFTEYESYDLNSTQGRRVLEVTKKNVTTLEWLLVRKNYLVIDFDLDQLEGNHLRALDNLLDVYGFNLTYEISTVKRPPCSVTACSFSGHCYASHDFRDYWCSCFPGFSGSDCGHGPLCEAKRYSCENGAVCRHAGDKLTLCPCLDGFTGPRCEISLPAVCEDKSGCTEECLENSLPEPCSCGDSVSLVPSRLDYARYEGTVQLRDVNIVYDCLNNSLSCHWIPLFEQEMADYLSSHENITTVEDLKISNITLGADIIFTFIGSKYERYDIEEYLESLIHQGNLSDIGLNSSHFSITEEPELYLKNVEVNTIDQHLLDEGAEFILSCIAQGSPHMVFSWFKDGVFVNVSNSQRKKGTMWTKLLSLDSADQYTAFLGIDHAEVLDQGRYTCQITDHGYQQCRSLELEVIESPQLKIYPLSLMVDVGANVTLKCMNPAEPDESMKPDDLSYSYSWFKNGKPIKRSLKQEYWEKLFPVGSMLTVKNIQATTIFTCHFDSLSRSVQVEVVNHSVVPWCPVDVHNNVSWDKTGPGIKAMVECPLHYYGTASRLCVLIDKEQARWLTPDYSQCVSDNLSAITKNFHKVKFGYGNTSIREIIADLRESLDGPDLLYPGEGEPYVDVLQDIFIYLKKQKAWMDILDTTSLFYRTVDVLFHQKNAIINYKKIEELQQLVNNWGLAWSNQSEKDIEHLSLDTMVVDLFTYNGSLLQDGIEEALPQPMFSYPSWYSSQITLHLDADVEEINNTAGLAVISYNNISQFHLRKSAQFVENRTGVAYEMAANIISVIASGGINIMSDVEFEWVKRKGKELRCGVSLDWGATWDLAACQTSQLLDNITLCSCSGMGFYTVFVVKEIIKSGQSGENRVSGIVLVGCVCCLVQSLLTLMFLTFRWLHVPRCYILCIKLQCCSAMSLTMIVFLYSICTNGEQNNYTYISASLQVFTMIAVSSQLCKLLLVYIEVVYIPKLNHLKPTVVAAVTGTPILVILCTHLVQNTGQTVTKSGLLVSGTMVFYTYIFCVVLLAAVFVFVFLKVYKHLKTLKRTKGVPSKRAVKERIGLVKRAAVVLAGITFMLVSSILYQNWPYTVLQYFFSLSCALVGCLLILCYIVHSESGLQIQGLHILRVDNTDLGYSSESDNSPPNFCDKQEAAPCVNRSGDIGLDTLPPRLQSNLSIGGEESNNTTSMLLRAEINGLANSGDSNDSGVQLELADTRSMEPLTGYIAMSTKPVRSVTFHNDLVTGYDKVRTYPKRSTNIKILDSQVKIVPKNRKMLLYPSCKQPEKRTVCVLIDRPQADIFGVNRELKTETRVMH